MGTLVAGDIARIWADYPNRGPRESLEAVERLRQALAPPPLPVIGVVGTNGKTGTATYLARLLTGSGLRAGLYVSPHLDEWTERIRVDDAPCDPGELTETLEAVHALAKSSGEPSADLRFFDLLTLAAELIIGRAGASVAVFEAGIGGRLDAIRVLEPSLVLLTSVAIDHAEILGEERSEVLREKLLAAPPGATVLSFPLGEGLDQLAERLAAEVGFRIEWVDPSLAERPGFAPGLPAYLGASLALALAGARRMVADAPSATEIDLRLPGRLERGEHAGVPYVLDAAHNEAAWLNLAAELERLPIAGPDPVPIVAVVSVSPGKRRDGLPVALRSLPGLEQVIVTRHASLPAADPDLVAGELRRAGGLEPEAIEDLGEASRHAFERARRLGGGVLFCGSTYLIGEVRRLLLQE